MMGMEDGHHSREVEKRMRKKEIIENLRVLIDAITTLVLYSLGEGVEPRKEKLLLLFYCVL